MSSGCWRVVRKSKASYIIWSRSATTNTSNLTSHVHVRNPCEAVAQAVASSSHKRVESCSNNMKVTPRVGPTTVAAATTASKPAETAVDRAPGTRTTSTRDWGGSAVAVCAAAATITTMLSMPSTKKEENSWSGIFAGMVTAMASNGMRSLAEPRKEGTKKDDAKNLTKGTTDEKEKDEHEEEVLFEVGKLDVSYFMSSNLL